MPDQKLSSLTAASALTGTELFYADDGSNDVKVTANQIRTFATGAAGFTVGTTAITGGTSGKVLYDNAGVLGELSVTGSGNVVLATSPTLTTPTLGVASATTINKVTLTAPGTGSTLTIADGKTLTASNTLTFTGTDSTSFAFPSTSDTVACLGTAQTFSKTQTITPAANTNALAVSSYSLTGANAQSLLDLAGTWNTSGTPTALKLNITNTASNASSLLFDFQVGGSSRLKLDNGASGILTLNGPSSGDVSTRVLVQSNSSGDALAGFKLLNNTGNVAVEAISYASGSSSTWFGQSAANGTFWLSYGSSNVALGMGTLTSIPYIFGTNNTERMRISGAGSVVVSAAALATNATDGFLYIPTCAGTPTGTPTSFSGRLPIIYDTANNKLYVYNGGWKGGTAPGAWS
jgi:hypothetical protein